MPSDSLTHLDPTAPLSQIARRVENLNRALALFHDALGLTPIMTFPGMAFLALGGTRLMLRETGRRDPADILYFRVPDLPAALARLRDAGASLNGEAHRIHRQADGSEEWMAFFKDDEDRDLALHAVLPPPG